MTISSSGVPVQDTQNTQRPELPAEIVEAAAWAIADYVGEDRFGYEPHARIAIAAAVAAGLLEHLLETAGYEKRHEGRTARVGGKPAGPFEWTPFLLESFTADPKLTCEQRDVWIGPWTPVPAESLEVPR